MAEFDPLVANGITYAPVKDIVMSDAPIYGVEPYRGNPMIAGSQAVSTQPPKPDEFVPQNKKSSSWWKWALGISSVIGLAIIGKKKGVPYLKRGVNALRNSNYIQNSPRLKSVLSRIKGFIPFVKKW